MTHYKKIIGLTGGIGTGKSTVSNILKNEGYNIVDADKISHDIMNPPSQLYKDVIVEFGEEILLENGQINRKKLGEIVFNDKKKLNKLNQITHPKIMEEINNQKDEYLKEDNIVFLDIPLLIEEKETLYKYNIKFNKIVLVYTDRETQIKRVSNRDKVNRKTVLNRIEAQMSLEEKIKCSDYVINNTGDFLELEKEVKEMLKKVTN